MTRPEAGETGAGDAARTLASHAVLPVAQVDEFVDVEFVIVFGVGDRRLQALAHVAGDTLAREFKIGQCGRDLLAADELRDKIELLRAHADEPRDRFRLVVFQHALAWLLAHYAFTALFALRSAAWPWKVRVGANSPNLWPTMSSVTSTGMCFWPLCTPKVSPTNCGRMVERRDHILITAFEPEPRAFSAYADQPLGVLSGLKSARRYLEHDLLTARDALIAVQGEVLESSNPGSAAMAVARHAPTVMLRPVIGASRAMGTALLGVGNQIDRGGVRRMEDVSIPFLLFVIFVWASMFQC